ncbi:helix-turn-helix domain-containing protein [Paenibacillus sp. GCM10012307]|uniref:AraC family transcriptional regulator n=1 Tax=Paenibacillus roseus TaxID=2798579 RepID=A0A934J4V4_9BACL|nr:AraC family transcriptional regulator [Paenibacillus roseus]MBJ6360382.1 AraC family transcriptional regulator [Paenibacillus roseus]
MESIQKQEQFKKDRLFVLPDYMAKELEDHALTRTLYVQDIGYFSQAKYHHRERKEGCEAHIFILCADGEGWIEIEGGRPIQLMARQLYVIPAGKSHRYGASERKPWSIYWFHLQGSDARELIGAYNLDDGALQLPISTYTRVIELFDQCYGLLAGKTYSRLMHIHVSQLMRALISCAGLESSHSQSDQKRESYFAEAVRYMTERLAETITLADLASHLGLSKPYLTYLFNKEAGFPPIDYFLRMKMQRASQLLDTTNLSVKEIAAAVGLFDPYYFSRLFKKMTGCSPTRYRSIQKG